MEEPIEVIAAQTWLGSRMPRALFLDGKWVDIVHVLKRWHGRDDESRDDLSCFRVQASDARVHTIAYDRSTQKWLYSRPIRAAAR